jgi:hypothetical protein
MLMTVTAERQNGCPARVKLGPRTATELGPTSSLQSERSIIPFLDRRFQPQLDQPEHEPAGLEPRDKGRFRRYGLECW